MAKGKKNFLSVEIDTFIEIPQRRGTCQPCGLQYTGHKEKLKCKSCGKPLETTNTSCVNKVPTGTWIRLSEYDGKLS